MIGRRSHDDAQSFEDAFNGGPPRDEHIADLVRFAETLCQSAVVEPTPEFRDTLRTQLMAEAATTLVAMPAEPRTSSPSPATTRPHRARRRLAALTGALVVGAGGVGLVASSASAVPGDMLYSVKRTVESVELQLHRDDASRGAFQLSRAAERLAEARQLSADGRSTSLIADTLDDFSSSAEDGSARLFTQFTDTGEETSIRKVNDFVAVSALDLSQLSTGLSPGAADDSLEAAKVAVTDLATEASSLCGSCTPPDVTPLLKQITDLTSKGADKKPSTGDASTPSGQTGGSSSKPGTTQAPAPVATSSVPKPAPTHAPATPAPAVTTKAPSLTDLTDPLIGGLLGDDTQPGLVPGLLGGLLGTPTPKP